MGGNCCAVDYDDYIKSRNMTFDDAINQNLAAAWGYSHDVWESTKNRNDEQYDDFVNGDVYLFSCDEAQFYIKARDNDQAIDLGKEYFIEEFGYPATRIKCRLAKLTFEQYNRVELIND